MMNYQKVVITSIAALITAGAGRIVHAEDTRTFTIRGRVVDAAHKPVKGATVKLLSESGDLIKDESTGPDGSFALEHKHTEKCILEVTPLGTSGMAMALFDGVPGDKDRSVVVELHKGFAVHGRVTHDGKGLKGLQVKAMPVKGEHEPSNIHGGGFALTDKQGQFTLTLTPGHKKVSIHNTRYTDLVSKYDMDVSVHAPMELSEVFLPSANQETH